MSRGSESIANEERFFAEAVGVVKSKGFRKVVPRKSGAAKFIDAECANGGHVSFWLKLGWATVPYGAIQFAVFAGKTGRRL